MAISGISAVAIAELGVNMILTADVKYSPDTIIEIVQAVKNNGKHITLHAGALSPDTLKRIAMLGGDYITIML